MNRYNERSCCKKCGCRVASTEYKAEFLKLPPQDDLERRLGTSHTVTIDQLKRTCICCGYTWYESCLDKEEENG